MNGKIIRCHKKMKNTKKMFVVFYIGIIKEMASQGRKTSNSSNRKPNLAPANIQKQVQAAIAVSCMTCEQLIYCFSYIILVLTGT